MWLLCWVCSDTHGLVKSLHRHNVPGAHLACQGREFLRDLGGSGGFSRRRPRQDHVTLAGLLWGSTQPLHLLSMELREQGCGVLQMLVDTQCSEPQRLILFCLGKTGFLEDEKNAHSFPRLLDSQLDEIRAVANDSMSQTYRCPY